jgi:hypothetical protein
VDIEGAISYENNSIWSNWIHHFLACRNLFYSYRECTRAGASDAGIVVSAIAILSAVLVICTRAIIDAIKSLKLKE